MWKDTIVEHRQAVRDATIETAAQLVAEQALRSVTMSQIAEKAGIGRATLYKYFPDVEAILLAWHERQIETHLSELASVCEGAGNAAERLEAVLNAYASITFRSRGHRDNELVALLHRDVQVRRAEHRLLDMLSYLIADAAREGHARQDVSPRELATYCVHALSAARAVPSRAAARRLVDLTLGGLRP